MRSAKLCFIVCFKMEDNWPLLTMSRGPFDAHLITGPLPNGVADKAPRAGAVFAHADDEVVRPIVSFHEQSLTIFRVR